MPGVHRLQRISTTGDKHPAKRIICIPIKVEMSTSATRTAAMKTGQTSRDKLNRDKLRTGNNLKATNNNNWNGHTRTEAREIKTTTIPSSKGREAEADQAVVADQVEDPEEEAGEGN